VGVGVAVMAPSHRQTEADSIRHAMETAVMDAYHEGVDLLVNAPEVRRRMAIARAKA